MPPCIFRRIKKVLIGDKILEKHPEIAFQKLKNIIFQKENQQKHFEKNWIGMKFQIVN